MKHSFLLSIALVVLACFIMPGCEIGGGSEQPCATEYPIILVHGAFFKDENLMGINYFYGIPEALEDGGAEVYVTQHRTFGSSDDRALDVAVELAYLFAVNPQWEKINIIAHSQGPLDSRYLISNLDITGVGPAKDVVASLTSISGTHKGSEVADVLWWAANEIPILGPIGGELISAGVDAFAAIFYYNEEDQNSMDTLESLTSDYVNNVFNPSAPDVPGIYYQSWGGVVTKMNSLAPEELLVRPLWLIMNAMGAGPNDCLVSLESAKWGKFRGEIPAPPDSDGINHFNEIGHFLGTNAFDAPAFFCDIAMELKQLGF